MSKDSKMRAQKTKKSGAQEAKVQVTEQLDHDDEPRRSTWPTISLVSGRMRLLMRCPRQLPMASVCWPLLLYVYVYMRVA
jgi:hypothetical protein